MLLRSQGLEQVSALIMEQIKRVKPAIVVIDSFKVFDDLAKSREELRKFGYEIAVNLMAWEATAFLIGEYGPGDYENNPLFSIVDGLFVLIAARSRPASSSASSGSSRCAGPITAATSTPSSSHRTASSCSRRA